MSPGVPALTLVRGTRFSGRGAKKAPTVGTPDRPFARLCSQICRPDISGKISWVRPNLPISLLHASSARICYLWNTVY